MAKKRNVRELDSFNDLCGKVMHHCHRLEHPVLVGELAVLLGTTIDVVEQIVAHLVEIDELRPATEEERLKRDCAPGVALFAIVGGAKIWLSST